MKNNKLIVIKGFLKAESGKHQSPKFINKRSQAYGSGATYPRNNSHDRHKNQVMYHSHVQDIERFKKRSGNPRGNIVDAQCREGRSRKEGG